MSYHSLKKFFPQPRLTRLWKVLVRARVSRIFLQLTISLIYLWPLKARAATVRCEGVSAGPLCLPAGDKAPWSGVETISGAVTIIAGLLLTIVGLIAVIFVIIGGYRYIVSAGNEDEVGKAKKTILNALIGVVAVILAYAMVRIVGNLVEGNL